MNRSRRFDDQTVEKFAVKNAHPIVYLFWSSLFPRKNIKKAFIQTSPIFNPAMSYTLFKKEKKIREKHLLFAYLKIKKCFSFKNCDSLNLSAKSKKIAKTEKIDSPGFKYIFLLFSLILKDGKGGITA